LASRRALITTAGFAAVLLAITLPAQAASDLVQKKTIAGPHGRAGQALRYAVSSGGKVHNSITISATDVDGPGGNCTETWVDYSTKPHQHFNPGVLVNCSGGTRTVSNVMNNDYPHISGMGVVVCEVPNTSGPIVRTSSNCYGNLSAMYLWSGKRYSSFTVKAPSYPNGVNVWKV
jgi:hypothetical protein